MIFYIVCLIIIYVLYRGNKKNDSTSIKNSIYTSILIYSIYYFTCNNNTQLDIDTSVTSELLSREFPSSTISDTYQS